MDAARQKALAEIRRAPRREEGFYREVEDGGPAVPTRDSHSVVELFKKARAGLPPEEPRTPPVRLKRRLSVGRKPLKQQVLTHAGMAKYWTKRSSTASRREAVPPADAPIVLLSDDEVAPTAAKKSKGKEKSPRNLVLSSDSEPDGVPASVPGNRHGGVAAMGRLVADNPRG